MECPYVALLWFPSDRQQSIAALRILRRLRRDGGGLRQLIARDGLAVFTRLPHGPAPHPTTYTLSGQLGVIIGTLFRRRDGSRASIAEIKADSDFAEACVASRGRHLKNTYWGAYVALLSDPRDANSTVFRDCSGMIECYYTTIHGIIIVFSDLRDLRRRADSADDDAWLVPLKINWRYIAGFVADSQMQIRETGFRGIYELLAGESLNTTLGRRSVHNLWNPVLIADSNPPGNVEDACHELRDTTLHCIEAWAGLHHSIVHSLSGGFDSSLVLSLLMRASKRPTVVSVNRFALGPAEDERRYARLAAQAAGVELTELPWDHEQRLEALCAAIPVTVKPTITQVFSGMDAAMNRVFAAGSDAEAIWTGQGGDHLFMAMKTGMAVVDCCRHHGFGHHLKAAFRDAAILTGKSYLRLAWEARGLRHSSKIFSIAKLESRPDFLAVDFLPECGDDYTRHPWTLDSAELPPAKRLQVIYLAELLNRHRPNYGMQKLEEFHPLLSQPLIELCLRIPVYHLLTGGRTRGLARTAFRSDLPPAILNRQQKGQTTHHTLGLIRANLPFMKTRLINGHLANQRLLNRDRVSATLQPHAPIAGPTLFSLLACVAAEVWLNSWLGSPLVGGISAKPSQAASYESTSR